MAEPVENKGDLTDKLEADRQKMATQVIQLQQSYNVLRWFRSSAQRYPWRWILGAVMTGFLLSRLPRREKRVYVYAPADDDSYRDGAAVEGKRKREPTPEERGFSDRQKRRGRVALKLWSVIKPILTTYLAREIYNRVSRSQSGPSTT
ncbi:MAG: hypothetical protein JOZ08_22675 [Verrucomicrobia bacterium]|nr:hypothetical protein [Verrucomicrobiota bacterium]